MRTGEHPWIDDERAVDPLRERRDPTKYRLAWEERRTRGGKGNTAAIRADGTLEPRAYVVDPDTGCHVWTMAMSGGSRANGPGCPVVGIDRAPTSVRREMWRRQRNAEPNGNITTRCRNARCVNIAHFIIPREER